MGSLVFTLMMAMAFSGFMLNSSQLFQSRAQAASPRPAAPAVGELGLGAQWVSGSKPVLQRFLVGGGRGRGMVGISENIPPLAVRNSRHQEVPVVTAGYAVRWLSGAATELGGLILFLLPGAPALMRFLFENK